jgi:hypothetical protein
MLRRITMISILACSGLMVAAGIAAPALDSAGRCRDNGKFVEAKLCEVVAAATRCRDIKSKKFAKCGTPGTEAVPVVSKPAPAK